MKFDEICKNSLRYSRERALQSMLQRPYTLLLTLLAAIFTAIMSHPLADVAMWKIAFGDLKTFAFFIQIICIFSIVLWQIWHCRLRQRSIALQDGRFTQADSNGVDERPTSTLDDAKQGISLVSLSAARVVSMPVAYGLRLFSALCRAIQCLTRYQYHHNCVRGIQIVKINSKQ